MYQIEDWHGNTCFYGKRFRSFEAAWAFLHERYPDDDASLEEYYVVEIKV